MKKSLVLIALFLLFMNNAYMQSQRIPGKDSLPDCQAMFKYYFNDSIQTFAEAYPYQFTDYSYGDVTGWKWDFGDGDTSTDENPLHFYSHYGDTVTACLTISTSQDCISTDCKSFMVSPAPTPVDCYAYFYLYQDSFTNCLCYRFHGYSNCETVSWHWDFGDGTESYDQFPLHQFPADGMYNVCLTTMSADSQSRSYCLQVYSGGGTIPTDCTTSFQIQTLESYPPQYRFVPFESDSIGWYYWDFGDGQQIYEKAPVHRFEYSGYYTVCLTIKTHGGCKADYCETGYFEGNTRDCQARWEGYPIDWVAISSVRSDSFPYPVLTSYAFHDQTKGVPVSWHWTFGDGTESYEQNPYHTFPETGIYMVCLEILTADNCTSQYCDSVYAGIQKPCNATFWHYALPWVSSLPPIYQFENDSSQPIVSWQWDLGDGSLTSEKSPIHRYDSTGYYTVCLTIITADGCSDTYCETSYFEGRHPQPGLSNYRLSIQTEMIVGSVNSCEGTASVRLLDTQGKEATAQSLWWSNGSAESFVNGLCTNTEYQVTAIDPEGCYITGSFVFMGGESIPYDTLWGNWKYEKYGMDFIFSLPVFREGYNCVWEFGDGDISQGSNVSHTYTEDGEYVVVLKLFDTEGNIAYTREIEVNAGVLLDIPDHSGSLINSVYPVPAKDQLHIALFSPASRQATLLVYNLPGQRVLTKDIHVPAGRATITLDIAGLPAGAFYGLFKTVNNSTVPFKFVK